MLLQQSVKSGASSNTSKLCAGIGFRRSVVQVTQVVGLDPDGRACLHQRHLHRLHTRQIDAVGREKGDLAYDHALGISPRDHAECVRAGQHVNSL